MRTEIVVAVKDEAQPTFEEIKEYESFSSKQLLRVLLILFTYVAQ